MENNNIKDKLSGNEAAAIVLKQMDIDVFPAFPITPSTEIPQYFSKYITDGKIISEFIAVESEHSAMAAAIGSSLSGARTATATSSNGLAFMWEMLHIAASMRAPIILELVCRSISGPLNIHNDHSDAYGMKDTGWLMLFSNNNQDVYDNTIIGTVIAEHPEVKLPIAIAQDGFITSHSVENIEILKDEVVKEFVGKYNNVSNLLLKERPITAGPLDLPGYLFEHKRLQVAGLEKAEKLFDEVAEKYEKISGRKLEKINKYNTENAEKIIIALGSTIGTIEEAIDILKEKSQKIGVISPRLFRPFPAEEIVKEIIKSGAKEVVIMDKCMDYSLKGGELYKEIVPEMYGNLDADVINVIYGIGGRDISVDNIFEIVELMDKENENSEEKYKKVKIEYIGLEKEEVENGNI